MDHTLKINHKPPCSDCILKPICLSKCMETYINFYSYVLPTCSILRNYLNVKTFTTCGFTYGNDIGCKEAKLRLRIVEKVLKTKLDYLSNGERSASAW